MNELNVDLIALKVVTKAFDEFVAACVDAEGRPVAPSNQALAKARGMLPYTCKMSYQVKK